MLLCEYTHHSQLGMNTDKVECRIAAGSDGATEGQWRESKSQGLYKELTTVRYHMAFYFLK